MITPLRAKFLTSASSLEDAPPATLSEVALLGRSNVGKSSLINALTQTKGLAKSSATPGKTRLINFFEVAWCANEAELSFRLIDLPGFGYAKVSKAEQEAWSRKLTRFLQERTTIKLFLHLVDARHPEQPNDEEMRLFIDSLMMGDQRLLTILTKADKINQKERAYALKCHPHALLVSSFSKEGIEALRSKVISGLFGEEV
ncbi:MAG: ribosome biogenesis GTP-binding protein YihA/YsxC [Campylobacterales bacterium]